MRCTRTTNLEVHHKNRSGGNYIGNAKVLCRKCYEATVSHGQEGKDPPPFSYETKILALHNAGRQCECTSASGCH